MVRGGGGVTFSSKTKTKVFPYTEKLQGGKCHAVKSVSRSIDGGWAGVETAQVDGKHEVEARQSTYLRSGVVAIF